MISDTGRRIPISAAEDDVSKNFNPRPGRSPSSSTSFGAEAGVTVQVQL